MDYAHDWRCVRCHNNWGACQCIELDEAQWEAQELAPYIHERILDPEPNTSERDGSVPVGIFWGLVVEGVIAGIVLLACLWL